MLSELQRLHEEIRANLDWLDSLATASAPPMDRLTAARLALTRASRARFMLLERLHPELVARAGAADRVALGALKAERQADRLRSAQHIGRWTPGEINSRWPDYCVAAHLVRTLMRVRVAREQRVIYPLLVGGGEPGVRAA